MKFLVTLSNYFLGLCHTICWLVQYRLYEYKLSRAKEPTNPTIYHMTIMYDDVEVARTSGYTMLQLQRWEHISELNDLLIKAHKENVGMVSIGMVPEKNT